MCYYFKRVGEKMKEKKRIIFTILVLILVIGVAAIYDSWNIKKSPSTKEEQEVPEKEIYRGATSIDEVMSQVELKIDENTKKELIESSSCKACMSSDLVGAMFNESISEKYKLLYVLNESTFAAFDYDYEFMTENYDFIVSVKKETIEKLGKTIFKEFTIPEKIEENTWYMGISHVDCPNDTCYYQYNTFGLTGSLLEGYETNLQIEGNKIIAKTIYIEYQETSQKDEEGITANVIVKDRYQGTTKKEWKDYTFPYQEELNLYDVFSKDIENPETYIYEFNENNRLVSVTKG